MKSQRYWELTLDGEKQASAAHEWFVGEGKLFAVKAVSPFLRTLQTAHAIALQGEWRRDADLQERSTGIMEQNALPHPEYVERFGDELARRDREKTRWLPPDGESLVMVRTRVARALERVYAAAPDQNALLVTHHDTILALMAEVEGMTSEAFDARYEEVMTARTFPLGNCRIIHYTRKDPVTGDVTGSFRFRRSACAMTDPNPPWVQLW